MAKVKTEENRPSLKEMVRIQMREFPNESADDSIDWIKVRWGVEMEKNTYNTYHSIINREGKTNEEPKKRGRKPGSSRTSTGIGVDEAVKLQKLLRHSDLDEPYDTVEKLRPLVAEFGNDFNRFCDVLDAVQQIRSDEDEEEEETPAPAKKK